MRKKLRLSVLLILLAILVSPLLQALPAQAQDGPPAVFRAYQCTVDAGRSTAEIRASLVDDQGRPITEDRYDLSVVGPAGAPLAIAAVGPADQRPPLHMILALDITTTMPIQQIEESLIGALIPGLADEDQLALITFSEEIAPRTAFYTDKGALANEHIRDLLTLEGDNRLYAAILEAVNSFPQDITGRKVVLVLTDSGRRASDDTSIADIVSAAGRNRVQVFAVGVVTRDRPAIEDLATITQETGGRLWTYTMSSDAAVPLGEAIDGFFEDLARTLNGEIVVQAELPDTLPDEAGSFTAQVAVTLLDGTTLNDTVDCPYSQLTHDIHFVNTVTDTLVGDTVDIEVSVTTDLNTDQVRVRFMDYDQELDILPIPADGLVSYTLDATQAAPGEHHISAELINLALRVLARTPEDIVLSTQRRLLLRYIPAPQVVQEAGQTSEARFEVDSEGFPAVQFTLVPASEPERQVYYGDPIPADENGRVALALSDIQVQAALLYPEMAAGERFLLGAEVPAEAGGRYPLAVADPVVIVLAPPAPVTPPAAEKEPFHWPTLSVNGSDILLPASVAALLAIINLVFYRQGRWMRVRNLIRYPGNDSMSPQLMTVTVHRDGLKQAHTLTKRMVTVGRGPSNDINLGGDSSISRQHAIFMWRKGHWYFVFRKRRASARINGKRRHGPSLYRVKPVTEIEIGRTLLVFHSNAQQDVSDYVKTDF